MIGLSIHPSKIVVCRLDVGGETVRVTQASAAALPQRVGFHLPTDSELPRRLEHALAGLGAKPDEAAIALVSDCLVLLAELPRGKTHGNEDALYAAEAEFPVDLEQLETDVAREGEDHSLVAACPRWVMDRIAHSAAQRNLSVVGVTSELFALMADGRPDEVTVLAHDQERRCWVGRRGPDATLAVESFALQGDPSSTPWRRLLRTGYGEGAAETTGVRICAPAALAATLRESLLQSMPHLQVSVLQGEDRQAITSEDPSVSTDEVAPILAAVKAFQRGPTPAVRFRARVLVRAHRGRRLAIPLQLAGWLLAAILVAAAAGLYREARRTAQQSDDARNQQLAAYRQLFGQNAASPADVVLRLKSEKARLTGLSGRAVGRPTYISALDALRQLAEVLPRDVRFDLERVRIGQEELSITGSALDHSDAQRLQQSMGAHRMFEALAPRTKRLDSGGVSFTISAAIRKQSS